MKAFGFTCDINKTTAHNKFIVLSNMQTWYYFNQLTHTAFHNCTSFSSPPQNLCSLLGLGLKFIPTPRFTTTPKDLKKENGPFQQFNQDMDLACYFANSPQDPSYNPRLHIKSQWNPPSISHHKEIHQRIKTFQSHVASLFQKKKEKATSSLTRREHFPGSDPKTTF